MSRHRARKGGLAGLVNGWVNINSDNIVFPEDSGHPRERGLSSTPQRTVTFEGQNEHVRAHPHPQHVGDGGVILDSRSVQVSSDGLEPSKLNASREGSFGGTSVTSIRTQSVADSSLQSTSSTGKSVKSYPRKKTLTRTNSRTDLAIEKATISQLSQHSIKGVGTGSSRRRERRESELSNTGSGGSGSGIGTIVHQNDGVQSRSNSISTKSESAQGSIVQHLGTPLGTPTMYFNEAFSQKGSHTSAMSSVKNSLKGASPPVHLNPGPYDIRPSSDPKNNEPYVPFSDSHDFIPYPTSKSLSNPAFEDNQTRFGTTPNTTNTSSRLHLQYLSNAGLDMEEIPMKIDYNDPQSNLTLKERMGATLSCLHCEETNKRMIDLQTDLEYLRAKALQGEFTCVECKQGLSGHTSSSDGGMRSRSSTASLSSARSSKHSAVSCKSSKHSVASSHSISSRTSRRSSKSILSKAQETSPSLMKIQKQFQNTNDRHKAEMKEKSQAHAKWHNEMNLKLAKLAMMVKDLNDDCAKRKEQCRDTNKELERVRKERNAISVELEIQRARVEIYEKQELENSETRERLRDHENELLTVANDIISSRDVLIADLTSRLEQTLDTLEFERQQQKLRRQIIFPQSRENSSINGTVPTGSTGVGSTTSIPASLDHLFKRNTNTPPLPREVTLAVPEHAEGGLPEMLPPKM